MAAEGYIAHWTNMADKHSDEPRFAFARKIAVVPKFIFSKNLEKLDWENTSIINGDLTEQITRLKGLQGQDLITFGGATFAAALLRSGLVNELQLFVNPVILGGGILIFQGITALTPRLIGSHAYTCGISVLKYRL